MPMSHSNYYYYRDFFANDDDNHVTDYFTPCACILVN